MLVICVWALCYTISFGVPRVWAQTEAGGKESIINRNTEMVIHPDSKMKLIPLSEAQKRFGAKSPMVNPKSEKPARRLKDRKITLQEAQSSIHPDSKMKLIPLKEAQKKIKSTKSY